MHRVTAASQLPDGPTPIIKSANHFDAQMARMARDSLSNPEIGGGLFLSARTT
jgi:hypothetical protein